MSVGSPAGSSSMRLGLIGGFSLSIQDQDVPLPMSAQRLIGFLAIHGQPVLRSFVAGSLWGDSTEEHAGGSLRSALWRLPRTDDPLVVHQSEHLAISPDVAIDLREGEALAHRVLDPSQGLDDVAAENEEVLSGDVLPDWTEEWVLMERERYHQLRLRALEALCRRLSAAGRFGQAVQAGLAAVAGEPLRESARHALIEAHLAEQNLAAAEREYESFRRLLRDEMGLEPSAELRALVHPPG